MKVGNSIMGHDSHQHTWTSLAGAGIRIRFAQAPSETYTIWLPLRVSAVPLPIASLTKALRVATLRCGMCVTGLQIIRPSSAAACMATRQACGCC